MARNEQNICIEEHEENLNVLMIPNADDSKGSDSDSDPEDSSNEPEDVDFHRLDEIPKISYRKILDDYSEYQSKLELDHIYEWLDGEKKYNEV